MTTAKLNIAVIGLDRMGQRHALNLLHGVPRTRLVAICTPAPHEVAWAEEHLAPEGVRAFADFEELMSAADLGIQAVVVASPTKMHVAHTLAALERGGVHVLCEKPVSTDVKELESVVQKAKANPTTKLMVGFVRCFERNYLDARRKIEAGLIGRPLVIRSQGTEKLDKSGFFIEYARVSGGIFVDTAMHDIDLTLSFFGDDAVPRSCYATGLISHHTEMVEFNDVDNAVGVVEF
ncbi:hypothetical protein BDW74DRAFT_176729 [Aspergillus multicolor]|uniref:Gfo/Idh/MocA family protein n=1 Tax=Aspergillus multicolor TaxID=41759 RepID=UPI003CCE0EA5